MLKNIVFDVGKVIVNWSSKMVFKPFFKGSKADLELLIDTVLRSSTWQELDRGTVSIVKAKEIYANQLPERLVRPMEDMIDNFYLVVKPFRRTVRLIRRLKKQGYNLYILSNFCEKIYPLKERFGDVFSLFDGYVFSFEELCVKPEDRIYQILLDRFRLKPEECLFIDDRKENIDGAIRNGINGFLFKNNYFALNKTIKALSK